MKNSDLANQYEKTFEMLSRKKWHKLSEAERLEVLQNVENFAAMKSNRPPAKLMLSSDLPKARNGYYNTDENVIVQNVQCIRASSSDVAVKNILHEGRHAYQYDCVVHPDKHLEIDAITIKEWKNNFDNYVTPQKGGDYQSYYMQPLEVDARLFAKDKYLSYVNKDVLTQNRNQILNQEVNCMWKGHKNNQSQENNNEHSQISSKSQTEAYKESLRVTPEQQEVNKKWNTEHQKNTSSSNTSSNPDAKDRGDSMDHPHSHDHGRGR